MSIMKEEMNELAQNIIKIQEQKKEDDREVKRAIKIKNSIDSFKAIRFITWMLLIPSACAIIWNEFTSELYYTHLLFEGERGIFLLVMLIFFDRIIASFINKLTNKV